MNRNRSIVLQNELKIQVGAIYRNARQFGWSNKELSEKLNALYARYPKDLPRHVKAYISGYHHALWDRLFEGELIYGYLWDGQIYQHWDTMPQELKAVCRKMEQGHYWKHFLINGIYKQF